MRAFVAGSASRWLAAALLLASLAGCAGQGTRVTLMPDHDGRVGAVVVGNAHGESRVDAAYGQAQAGGATAPRALAPSSLSSLEKAHALLLAAQPSPPRSFTLNFLFDSMTLTPESARQLPKVLDVVRERLPTIVTVFGYTDAVGAKDYNLELSAQRARAVAAMLKKIDPSLPVQVEYFGDKSPLVPSRPGVPEPRNRRAEIFVL